MAKIVPSPKGKPAPKPAEPKQEYKRVLKVCSCDCEGCEKKVKEILTRIEGVYATEIDLRQQKVTVKGNFDLETLIQELEKKTRKRAVLWPQVQGKPEAKLAESKPEPLKYKKWVLKVPLHCEIGCPNDVKKALKEIKGVRTVNIDFTEQKATVVGNVDLQTLIEELYKKTRKRAELWPRQRDQKQRKRRENDNSTTGGNGAQPLKSILRKPKENRKSKGKEKKKVHFADV